MQILIQSSSELVAGIGTLFATLLLARFTLNRVRQLPDEEKSLGLPLWVATIGILLLGIGSVFYYIFGVELGGAETPYYFIVIIGGGFLALSATMIMGWTRGRALPIATIVILLSIAVIGRIFTGLFGVFTLLVVGIFGVFLFGMPIVLFTYLTIKTKRITSFGFALFSMAQLLLLVLTSVTDPAIAAVLIAIRLYGPAILITALVLSETGICAELMVYALTVSSMFYIVSYILISPIQTDIFIVTTIIFSTFAASIGIGTSAFIFTRWKQNRNQATLILGLFFIIIGFANILGALTNVELIGGLNIAYISLIFSILGPMFLNLSAIVALDWKRIVLLPILLFATPFALLITSWPQGIETTLIPFLTPAIALTGILQMLIPMGLYGLIWWRMKKAEAPGRNRPLFLAIGIVFMFISLLLISTDPLSLISSLTRIGAFSIWWLGVTGRADKLLGTTAE